MSMPRWYEVIGVEQTRHSRYSSISTNVVQKQAIRRILSSVLSLFLSHSLYTRNIIRKHYPFYEIFFTLFGLY